MNNWMRRKSPELDTVCLPKLARTLSWWHLVALGVAGWWDGIYTLVGVGANWRAGRYPVLCGGGRDLCLCGACLCGSAGMIRLPEALYYSYVALGEIIAWVVGWSLILEYSLVCSAVAVGWSGYVTGFLTIGMPLPWLDGRPMGRTGQSSAMAIIGAVAGLLAAARAKAPPSMRLVVIKSWRWSCSSQSRAPFPLAAFHPSCPTVFQGTIHWAIPAA